MEGDTVQLRKLQNHIKNEKNGETATEIAGNWKYQRHEWINTPPVVKWTRTHLLACLMSHLTKIDHFINEPTQQHENNENKSTIFSFLKKKQNNKNKSSTFTKGRMVRCACKDTKSTRKINQTLTRISLIIKPKQKKYSSL